MQTQACFIEDDPQHEDRVVITDCRRNRHHMKLPVDPKDLLCPNLVVLTDRVRRCG